jgi:hypothetical protein
MTDPNSKIPKVEMRELLTAGKIKDAEIEQPLVT